MRRRPARGGAGHPRHHARHQRDDRAQGRAHGADHHRRLSRFHRDGDGEPLRAVRHRHGEAGAAGAPALALPHSRTAQRLGRSDPAARRGGGRSHRRPACRRRHRERRDRPPALLRQPGARAPGPRHPAHGAAGPRDHAFLRGRAGDARVRALLHRLRQRLRPAGHGALPAQSGGWPARSRFRLPALRHAVRRGRRRHRDGDPLPHPPRRIRDRWAAPSLQATSPANAGSIACSPSTWGARPPRSA